MAQVLKRRSLINSGKRRRGRVAVRRRRNAGRKRLTPLQIKYFGTARQRAGLRASRKRRARNAGRFSIRKSKKAGKKLFGAAYSTAFGKAHKKYKRRKNAVHRRRAVRRRRKNIGQIFSIGLAGLAGGNPGRKRKRTKRSVTKMARRRRRHNAGGARRRRRARVVVHRRRRRSRAVSNPVRRRRRYARHSRRRRSRVGNPGFGLGSATGLLKNAVGVIGGAVASRYATQLALGANNTGVIGYLGNAVAALALGWAAGKFLKSPQVGAMVTLGGFTGLALRLLSDLTPIGQYVNLSLQGRGMGGDAGIGLITDSTFFVPTTFANGSMTNAQIPSQVQQLVAAGSTKQAGIGAYRRRRAA